MRWLRINRVYIFDLVQRNDDAVRRCLKATASSFICLRTTHSMAFQTISHAIDDDWCSDDSENNFLANSAALQRNSCVCVRVTCIAMSSLRTLVGARVTNAILNDCRHTDRIASKYHLPIDAHTTAIGAYEMALKLHRMSAPNPIQ